MTPAELSDSLKQQGVSFAQNNQLIEAKQKFEQALAIAPQDAAALNNLGNILDSLGEHDAAIAAYTQAISLQPNYKTAYLNLALTHQQLGNNSAVIDGFLKVRALDPASFQANHMLGICYFRIKEFKLALEAVEHALLIEPHNLQALQNLSSLLTILGEHERSVQVLHQIVNIDPAHPTANYHLAKLGQAAVPSAAPASYVIELFDEYAATFEDQLVAKLNYQAPEQIAKIVNELNFNSDRDVANPITRVLDLGCGTGLVGGHLSAPHWHLVGVDLSTKMLSVARTKNCYSELVHSAIDRYLEVDHAPFDLVTSADVFIYIGDLNLIFSNVRRQLNDNGWFIFSVEKTDQPHFVLRSSGRYAHSENYLRGLAAQYGFKQHAFVHHILRFDGGNPIEGWVVALQKTSLAISFS